MWEIIQHRDTVLRYSGELGTRLADIFNDSTGDPNLEVQSSYSLLTTTNPRAPHEGAEHRIVIENIGNGVARNCSVVLYLVGEQASSNGTVVEYTLHEQMVWSKASGTEQISIRPTGTAEIALDKRRDEYESRQQKEGSGKQIRRVEFPVASHDEKSAEIRVRQPSGESNIVSSQPVSTINSINWTRRELRIFGQGFAQTIELDTRDLSQDPYVKFDKSGEE